MLERHELDAFLTLAEELHFGRTAQRLGVSTTRVSQTIRKLERRVGVPLFDRTSRRVTLTAVGRQLEADLRPAWAQIAAGVHRAVAAGRGMTGTLRVGFVGAAGGQLLLQVASLFRSRHPDCAVEIREAQLGEADGWLRDGVVDALLTSYPIAAVPGGVLISEARMLAVPANHPLATRDRIALADVGPPMAAPATFQELLTRVGDGEGVYPVGAHVRRYYARPDVAYVPIVDAPPVRWGLAWTKDGGNARVLAFNAAALELVAGSK
ncbi:LysR family transcriptional regulator [Asanoa sp. NPDC050611]|uniref:LysR family transcriptional regulator n=1 Tax=Asanoa sp. NPDC050611 TaxID=3157098 RepID=UPI0034091BCE